MLSLRSIGATGLHLGYTQENRLNSVPEKFLYDWILGNYPLRHLIEWE